MRRCFQHALIGVLLFSGTLLGAVAARAAADDNAELASADRALVASLAKMDRAAAAKMLDADFLWTNADGATMGRSVVLGRIPHTPLGNESGAQVTRRIYGRVGVVQASSGKVHVLRVWVKRPAGWRVLIYQEVRQRETPAPPPAATTNECENPCRGVPYTAKNDAEKGIIASWGQLETAVRDHDPKAWAPHFLDEFVLISSNATEPATKPRRIVQLSRPGIGPAPPELAAQPQVRFFHFGESVVMVAQSKPYTGKPSHITRLWVLRDGMWRMAFSYQTAIQAAPSAVPPKKKM